MYDDDIRPWEQQPGEPARAFHYFVAYREMGHNRMFSEVARQLNKHPNTIKMAAKKWNWKERARAWDREQDRLLQVARRAQIVEMCQRHATQAQSYSQAIMLPVVAILRRLEQEPELRNMRHLPLDELVKLATASAKSFADVARIERLARGESTEHLDMDVEAQVNTTNEQKYHVIQEIINTPELADRIRDNFRQRTGNRVSEERL